MWSLLLITTMLCAAYNIFAEVDVLILFDVDLEDQIRRFVTRESADQTVPLAIDNMVLRFNQTTTIGLMKFSSSDSLLIVEKILKARKNATVFSFLNSYHEALLHDVVGDNVYLFGKSKKQQVRVSLCALCPLLSIFVKFIYCRLLRWVY